MSSLYTKSLKIRNRKSKKNRQYDGQKKKYIVTNSHLQKITQKTKDCAIWTPLKIGDEFIYSVRVSTSCDKDISRTTMCGQLSYITYKNRFMVFNATFNNISDILCQSVLLVEETAVPEKTPEWPEVTDKLRCFILCLMQMIHEETCLFQECHHYIRKVWRYQRGNQKPYIEEEQTI